MCLEIFKRITRAIPVNIKDGGALAGSSVFEFRNQDDPRYVDRRMQSLLRRMDDNFIKFDHHEVASLSKQFIPGYT